jgi:hypothetical protein
MLTPGPSTLARPCLCVCVCVCVCVRACVRACVRVMCSHVCLVSARPGYDEEMRTKPPECVEIEKADPKYEAKDIAKFIGACARRASSAGPAKMRAQWARC